MNTSELKSKLIKQQDFLKNELSQIRTGRVTPSLVENILVEAYGTKMTVKELGAISVLDSQNLVVAPWDKSLIKSVAKAIRDTQPSLSPIEDGEKLRVPVPALTEERRKELAKTVGVKVEECKNAIRIVRQEAMKDIDKMFVDKAIGEDEKFRLREETEKTVKEFSESFDVLGEQKKSELMTV